MAIRGLGVGMGLASEGVVACCEPNRPRSYEPRRPRDSLLHRVLLENVETLCAQAREGDDAGPGLPAYVERELRAVVSCGDPAAGFLRLQCERCGHGRIVPFACRSRTACPSCATRLMEALVAHLCDRVLPARPLRQWTASFPFALRRLLAADADLLSAVNRSFVRLVFLTLRTNAPVTKGRAGAISLLQRFDSNLGLDPHIHLCSLDGVYALGKDGVLEFHDTGAPTSQDVERVAVRLYQSIRRLLCRRGLLTREGELAPRESQEVTSLERLYEAAARDFIPSGTLTEKGEVAVRSRTSPVPQRLGPLLVDVDGVNVHADLRIEAGDRQGRERLIRYGLRPPFADEQIQRTSDGRIAFALRKRRRNGDTHRFFAPLQFLRRLAWLVVPPRQCLVRYQGILAPAARWRRLVVPAPPSPPEEELALSALTEPLAASRVPISAASTKASRLSWAQLLRRVYDVDSLACPKPGFGGRMRAIAAITSPPVIRRILEHLGLPTVLPAFERARGPPQREFCAFD